MKPRQSKPGKAEPKAPLWAILVSYLVAWPLGGWILVHEVQHSGRAAVMAVGLYLVVLPMAGARPLDLIRDLLGR